VALAYPRFHKGRPNRDAEGVVEGGWV